VKKRRRPDRTGLKQLACWLPADLMDRLAAHVSAAAGRTQRAEVVAALERHLVAPAAE
jgi:hypothetical protein